MPWYDQLEALRAQPPDATPAELMEALKLRKSQVSDLQAIDKCFDLPALEKVRAAASPQQTGISSPSGTQKANNLPYTLSFRSALALAGLKKVKLADFSQTFHAALDATLSLRLTTVQIEALVDWITKGNSPETFDPPEPGKKGKSYKGTKGKNQPTGNADDLKPVLELFKKVEAEIARGDGETTYQDELRAHLEQMRSLKLESAELKPKTSNSSLRTSNSKAEPSGWFWEMLLGVKFVSQLRSKAKKGELTTTDKVLVLLYWVVGKPLEFIFEHLGKLFKESAKDFWHWLKHTIGETLSKTIQWAIPLLIICALIWGAGKVYQYAIVNPFHWIESEIKSGFHWGGSKVEEPVTPAPTTPSAELDKTTVRSSELEVRSSNLKPKTPNSSLLTPHSTVITYQPAISFAPSASPDQTLYDPQLLEQEIAAVPKNAIVKAFPISPDEGMPGDLAVSRMQGVTDPDKYTMKIGNGTQKINSINTTTTNLIINYKSTDPFNLDSSGPLNFFWEDVLYIHTDEIEVEGQIPYKIYQCSLVVSGSKYALTIQCASSDDLKHLVSTMEYFIRNSRLGHDTALAGMPYPSQGLVLNNDGVVDKLWAESPMDKAGMALGDHLWSIGKVTSEKQSRSDLEVGLRSLPVTFFYATASEWDRALHDRNPAQTNSIRPKLRKVILTTQ